MNAETSRLSIKEDKYMSNMVKIIDLDEKSLKNIFAIKKLL